ncbi:hypothetical protein B0H13DRAFT_1903106 [Mycena leptocephala]|nr:hypothetical protein B0H13DRAFT_1903106 [Mycena leptocephala]
MPVHVRVHPPVHVRRPSKYTQSQKPKAKSQNKKKGATKKKESLKKKLRPESHAHHVKRPARPVYAHGVGFALVLKPNAPPTSLRTHSLRAQKLRPEAPKAKDHATRRPEAGVHAPAWSTRGFGLGSVSSPTRLGLGLARDSAHAPSAPAPFVHAKHTHPASSPRTPLAPRLEAQARAIGRTAHRQARVIERTPPARMIERTPQAVMGIGGQKASSLRIKRTSKLKLIGTAIAIAIGMRYKKKKEGRAGGGEGKEERKREVKRREKNEGKKKHKLGGDEERLEKKKKKKEQPVREHHTRLRSTECDPTPTLISHPHPTLHPPPEARDYARTKQRRVWSGRRAMLIGQRRAGGRRKRKGPEPNEPEPEPDPS